MHAMQFLAVWRMGMLNKSGCKKLLEPKAFKSFETCPRLPFPKEAFAARQNSCRAFSNPGGPPRQTEYQGILTHHASTQALCLDLLVNASQSDKILCVPAQCCARRRRGRVRGGGRRARRCLWPAACSFARPPSEPAPPWPPRASSPTVRACCDKCCANPTAHLCKRFNYS